MNDRIDEVWEELSTEMDKLSETGREARELQQRGGRCHHPLPSNPWKQVCLHKSIASYHISFVLCDRD